MSKTKNWSQECIWPKPLTDGDGEFWSAEDAELLPLDEDAEELIETKNYFDKLVETGFLNEDYSLDPDDLTAEDFDPEFGGLYWNDGQFDIDGLEWELSDHMNLLKIPLQNLETDPVGNISHIINYEFVNENLLRQAFTRRSFAVEHGLSGNSEELEFLGDSVLNGVVTRELIKAFSGVNKESTDAPFVSTYNEGELSRMRSHFVSKEYLGQRAKALNFDRFILYGSDEKESESSCEDAIEALIGAVAIDSNWDQDVIAGVVDSLLCLQLSKPDQLLKKTYYDLFNAWHQKHFGKMPDYEVYGNKRHYCAIRFSVPENEQGIRTTQRIDAEAESRSAAREEAAQKAYAFVVNNGLWINLKDAQLTPKMDDAINQLQELYQKGYVDAASFEFEEIWADEWRCDCVCGGVDGFGHGKRKVEAKKKAAYMVLVRLLQAAGICEQEWIDRAYGECMV